MLACRGADIILHPTAYESPCEEYGWWDTLYSAHAMSNAVWCISANLIGATPGGSSHFFGGSRILDPLGCEVAAAVRVPCGSSCVSDVLVAELMLAEGLRLGRQRNGCFLAERKPWLYGAPAFNPRAMA